MNYNLKYSKDVQAILDGTYQEPQSSAIEGFSAKLLRGHQERKATNSITYETAQGQGLKDFLARNKQEQQNHKPLPDLVQYKRSREGWDGSNDTSSYAGLATAVVLANYAYSDNSNDSCSSSSSYDSSDSYSSSCSDSSSSSWD